MKKILIPLSLAVICFANPMYLNKDVKVIKDGKEIATAKLLSPVEVVKKGDKTSQVKLVGYVNDNYQEEIVKSFTQNENYASFHDKNDNATFKGDVNPYIKNIKKAEDEYGEIWHEVSLEFSVNNDSLVDSKDAILKEAKSLYEQTCSPCHHLHDPKEYTVNQWPSNLESMVSADYVALEADEKAMIIKYLQNNAKDIK